MRADTPGLRLGMARKEYKKRIDARMTQTLFAAMLSEALGRPITRETVAKWETDDDVTPPNDALEIAEELLKLERGWIRSGGERVEFVSGAGSTTGERRRLVSVKILRGGASQVWNRDSVTIRDEEVPFYFGEHRDHIEVPDLSLMPFAAPTEILSFEPDSVPHLNTVNLLKQKKNPAFHVIRELRTNSGGVEMYCPDVDAVPYEYKDFEPCGYLVIHAERLRPLKVTIDEEGLSFAAMRKGVLEQNGT